MIIKKTSLFLQPKFEEVKPPPTLKMDRTNDAVYKDTMNVVKCVVMANQETMQAQPETIFNNVKVRVHVGLSLLRVQAIFAFFLPFRHFLTNLDK